MEIGYELPVEYESLLYLSRGDIGTVKDVCTVWNCLHPIDTVRVGRTSLWEIYIIGRCCDVQGLLDICNYLTTSVARVSHEKTIIELEI